MHTLILLGLFTFLTSVGFLVNTLSKFKKRKNDKSAFVSSEEIITIDNISYATSDPLLITIIKILFEKIKQSELDKKELQENLADIKEELEKITNDISYINTKFDD